MAENIKTKIFKLITRVMEDTRGLDSKYPEEFDAPELADTLNTLAEHTTSEILTLIDNDRERC